MNLDLTGLGDVAEGAGGLISDVLGTLINLLNLLFQNDTILNFLFAGLGLAILYMALNFLVTGNFSLSTFKGAVSRK